MDYKDSVTGQGFRVAAVQTESGALPFPVVTLAEVQNGHSQLNQSHISGKQLGAAVIVELASGELVIAVAQGSEPTDPWKYKASSDKVVPR